MLSMQDASFLREYELLSQLRGECAIIQTLGALERDGIRYIVVEPADGALEVRVVLCCVRRERDTETAESAATPSWPPC